MAAAAGSDGPPTQDRAGLPDAGGMDLGGFDAAAEAETTRATMESMMDSITTLQNQIAAFMEDPDVFLQRCPIASYGELGPAVRELRYAHGQEYDRSRMSRMEEQLAQNDLRMNDLESSQGYITGELTTVNATIGTMSNTLTTLRAAGPSSSGAPRTRELLTGMRGFDKLKAYIGAASQWKEWRFRVSTWLTQSSTSFETLMVKLDASEIEPKELEEGRNLVVGPAELTTEEEWGSEQLYQFMVQKCEGIALKIVSNQNTRGLIAW